MTRSGFATALLVGASAGVLIGWSPGLAAMLLAIVGVGRLIRRYTPAEDRAFLVRLYAIGIGLRIVIGAALHLFAMHAGQGYLVYGIESFDVSGDSAYVPLRAWLLTLVSRGRVDPEVLDEGVFTDTANFLVHPYRWLFWVFGFSPFAVKLFNGVLGALLPFVAYGIAKLLAEVRTARIAAWLVALFPSLMFWSMTNLKETSTALGMAWGCWATMRLIRGPFRLWLVLEGGCATALVWLARSALMAPLLACLALGAAVGVMISRLRSWPALAGLLVIIVAVAGPPVRARRTPQAYWSGQVNRVMNELSSRQTGHLLSGGSAYQIYDPIVYKPVPRYAPLDFSPRQIVRATVLGLGYFLFTPVPWRLSSTLQALTIPEMCTWYVLAVLALVGAAQALWRGAGSVMVLIAPAVILTTLMALGTGNVGIAFRHRGIVLPLYLILGALGIGWLRGWHRKRYSTADAVHLV